MKFNDDWFAGPAKELAQYFYTEYFLPLVEILGAKQIENAKKTPLQIALESGNVNYSDGVFTGIFNMKISNELSEFAKFEPRGRGWKVIKPVPPIIKTTISKVKFAAENALKAMNTKVNELDNTALARIDSLRFNIEKPVSEMLSMAAKDVIESISVAPDFTPDQWANISEAYNDHINLSIVDWHDEQITRLREMISRNMVEGMNRTAIMDSLMDEYGVSENKARFLARQETTLLSSFIQEERYTAAGVQYYIWDAVGDNRTVGNPAGKYPKPTRGHGNHFDLNGTVCRMDDPSVFAESIADAKKGIWKTKRSIGANDEHPGNEFLCRCTRRPLTRL